MPPPKTRGVAKRPLRPGGEGRGQLHDFGLEVSGEKSASVARLSNVSPPGEKGGEMRCGVGLRSPSSSLRMEEGEEGDLKRSLLLKEECKQSRTKQHFCFGQLAARCQAARYLLRKKTHIKFSAFRNHEVQN